MLALQHLLRYANHATFNAPDRVVSDPEDAAVTSFVSAASDGRVSSGVEGPVAESQGAVDFAVEVSEKFGRSASSRARWRGGDATLVGAGVELDVGFGRAIFAL